MCTRSPGCNLSPTMKRLTLILITMLVLAVPSIASACGPWTPPPGCHEGQTEQECLKGISNKANEEGILESGILAERLKTAEEHFQACERYEKELAENHERYEREIAENTKKYEEVLKHAEEVRHAEELRHLEELRRTPAPQVIPPPVLTPAPVSMTPVCSGPSRRLGVINHRFLCLQAGAPCAWRYRRQYLRYHFVCARSGRYYRLRHH
jgi:hypothetical protein